MKIDVSIISSGHHVADARLHRLAAALHRCGMSVEVIARGETFEAPPEARFRAAFGNTGMFSRVIRALTLPFLARGEVIIAIDPDLSLPLLIAGNVRHKKVACDVHEDYVSLLRDRSWAKGLVGVVARKIARDAIKIAAEADLTIVADEHVPPLDAKNRIVVRNLPDFTIIQPTVSFDEAPRAVYIGDVRKSRGLHAMLAAIESAPHWRLDIVGPIAVADQPFVDGWLATSPAKDRVHFYGRCAPIESWRIARGAWVGLSILDATPAFLEAVPSKIYEYAAAGLGIISSPLPRVSVILEGRAAFATTAGEIASALEGWSSRPQEWQRAREASSKIVESGDPYLPFAERIRALLSPRR
ncbi:MAG: glycosyl transferase [Actinomycetes bacterium]